AGATFDQVKSYPNYWRLADTPLVHDLFDALESARSEIAELKDAQSSKGYIDSLREIPSDVTIRAAQRLANAHLTLVHKLGPVAESHPFVHWLLGLEPNRHNAKNPDKIA